MRVKVVVPFLDYDDPHHAYRRGEEIELDKKRANQQIEAGHVIKVIEKKTIEKVEVR